MNLIYLAIRSIVNPRRVSKDDADKPVDIPKDMLQTLSYVESSLRGRQHLLRHPQLRVQKGSQAMFGQLFDVGLALSDLTASLLRALERHSPAAYPQVPAFQTLLDAPDDTGILEQQALRMAESSFLYGNLLPAGIRGAGSHYESNAKGLVLRIRFEFRRGRVVLYSTRDLEFGLHAPTTLREAAAFVQRALDLQKTTLSRADQWPEFSQSKQEAGMSSVLRGQMQQFLYGLSPVEREYLAMHWDELKPTAQMLSHP